MTRPQLHDDEGMLASELAILMPALLLLLMLAVQFGLWSHASQLARAAAEATTERMNLPTAVLLLGFLIFIVFPAVTAITGVNTGTCLPGDPDCPTPAAAAP